MIIIGRKTKIFSWGILLTILGLVSLVCFGNSKSNQMICAEDPNFYYNGRIDYSNPKAIRFTFPGVSISAKFESQFCIIHLKNKGFGKDEEGNPYKNYYQIIVDGKPTQTLGVADSQFKHRIELGPGIHELTIYKKTESTVGEGIFEGIEIENEKKLLPWISQSKLKIEFIGNSITCGYGNEGADKDCRFSPETENNFMAYGSILARGLQAEYMTVAFSGKGVYQNYDTTDKTTFPKIYVRTIAFEEEPLWDFKRWTPDVVVLNVGTNDFAHSAPPEVGFVKAYKLFLKNLRSNYPNAKIICALGPMMSDNWPVGAKALTTAKSYINKAVAETNDPKIITFYFTPQTTEDFGCDFHPKVQRHIKMAEELTLEINKFLKD